MSRTREIPRREWQKYLDDLSRRERDHGVRIELDEKDQGSQIVAGKMPLLGISCETKGSQAGALDISVTRSNGQDEFTHRLEGTRRIYAEEADDGHIQCLDIENDSGRTLIYFD